MKCNFILLIEQYVLDMYFDKADKNQLTAKPDFNAESPSKKPRN